jgi:hypothetical protein
MTPTTRKALKMALAIAPPGAIHEAITEALAELPAKPAECAIKCPENQVCDYCQGKGEALAEPAPRRLTEKEALDLWNYEASKSGYNVHELPARYVRIVEARIFGDKE